MVGVKYDNDMITVTPQVGGIFFGEDTILYADSSRLIYADCVESLSPTMKSHCIQCPSCCIGLANVGISDIY